MYFRLGTDERCPFLNGQNLCDLYIALGPEHSAPSAGNTRAFYSWWGSFAGSGARPLLRRSLPSAAGGRASADLRRERKRRTRRSVRAVQRRAVLPAGSARQAVFRASDRSLPIEARLRRCLTLSQQMQDEWDGFPPLTTLKKRICPMQTPYSPSPRSLNPLTKADAAAAPRRTLRQTRCTAGLRHRARSCLSALPLVPALCAGRRSDERYAC